VHLSWILSNFEKTETKYVLEVVCEPATNHLGTGTNDRQPHVISSHMLWLPEQTKCPQANTSRKQQPILITAEAGNFHIHALCPLTKAEQTWNLLWKVPQECLRSTHHKFNLTSLQCMLSILIRFYFYPRTTLCLNLFITAWIFLLFLQLNILKFMPEFFPYFPHEKGAWKLVLMFNCHMAFQHKN
jgi:hypothetical protein